MRGKAVPDSCLGSCCVDEAGLGAVGGCRGRRLMTGTMRVGKEDPHEISSVDAAGDIAYAGTHRLKGGETIEKLASAKKAGEDVSLKFGYK